MGQAHSRFGKPIRLWHRRKSKATGREPAQQSFVQMSPPRPEADLSSAKMDQPSDNTDPSSTTANMAPAFLAPYPKMHSDTVAEASDQVGKADKVDKVEERTTGPQHQPTGDRPDQPTHPAEEPMSSGPAVKREHTPPHRIRIWTAEAWQAEHVYGNVHDHLTQTLNRIRQQQTDSDRTSAAARRSEADVYKAADSCTLALEDLVGHFSTKFFHHTGPERIISMMATIDADATALDDLRLKQLQMANYGYSLEQELAQTEGHIRELAELAKRIRDGDVGGEASEDADAEGDTDPEVDMEKDGAGGASY